MSAPSETVDVDSPPIVGGVNRLCRRSHPRGVVHDDVDVLVESLHAGVGVVLTGGDHQLLALTGGPGRLGDLRRLGREHTSGQFVSLWLSSSSKNVVAITGLGIWYVDSDAMSSTMAPRASLLSFGESAG